MQGPLPTRKAIGRSLVSPGPVVVARRILRIPGQRGGSRRGRKEGEGQASGAGAQPDLGGDGLRLAPARCRRVAGAERTIGPVGKGLRVAARVCRARGRQFADDWQFRVSIAGAWRSFVSRRRRGSGAGRDHWHVVIGRWRQLLVGPPRLNHPADSWRASSRRRGSFQLGKRGIEFGCFLSRLTAWHRCRLGAQATGQGICRISLRGGRRRQGPRRKWIVISPPASG